MIKRITGRCEGRSDDSLEVLTRRLVTYRDHTQPIINLFKQQDKLWEIDAEGDVDSIYRRILTALKLDS